MAREPVSNIKYERNEPTYRYWLCMNWNVENRYQILDQQTFH